MYVYQMSFPIDEFGAMRKFQYLFNEAVEHDKNNHEECYDCYFTPEQLRAFLRRCLRTLARMRTYWEGDVRSGELFIGSIPGDGDYQDLYHYIALKQDNNGSSFIVSEIPFPHLSEQLIEEKIDNPVTQSMQDKIKLILDTYSPSDKPQPDEAIFGY